jgi:hypothetical protein
MLCKATYNYTNKKTAHVVRLRLHHMICLGPIRVICWNAIYSFSASDERATHHIIFIKFEHCLYYDLKVVTWIPDLLSYVSQDFVQFIPCSPPIGQHVPEYAWTFVERQCRLILSPPPPTPSFPKTPSHGFNNNKILLMLHAVQCPRSGVFPN